MNKLGEELLEFFYDRNETLQEDFAAFMETEEYEVFMITQGYGHLIGWLTPKRWRVCITCGEPFIAFDKWNKMKYCQRETYRRHNKQGEPFPSAVRGKSVCFVEAARLRRREEKRHRSQEV